VKPKLTYIVSNIDKALAFEWVALYLDKNKFDLSFILLNPDKSYLQSFLEKNDIPVLWIPYEGKKDFIKSIFKIYFYLKKNKIKTVHTHLFDANIVGLLAAKLVGIKNRIHTRHHGSQNHTYFPRAVFYDKIINRLSTKIIAISENVKNILINWENAKSKKVVTIRHGFDLTFFKNHNKLKINEIKASYNPRSSKLVFGVIARYTHLKGIQYIIPAFKKVLEKHPAAHLILANTQGDYQAEIKKLLTEIPKKNYTEIVFEQDIATLYQVFDYYIHTPINNHSEAFGQTYVEALASGIPSIFTLSGVANEFIKNEKNALVVNYQDSEDIYQKMMMLIDNKPVIEDLIENGKTSVKQFELNPFIENLTKLYLE